MEDENPVSTNKVKSANFLLFEKFTIHRPTETFGQLRKEISEGEGMEVVFDKEFSSSVAINSL